MVVLDSATDNNIALSLCKCKLVALVLLRCYWRRLPQQRVRAVHICRLNANIFSRGAAEFNVYLLMNMVMGYRVTVPHHVMFAIMISPGDFFSASIRGVSV